ncbi:MAG: hypothetical protein LLG04_05445 [Parachlamydia sp.]|nr:hypothetical protein [Parachlamydia sp.]
MSHLNIRMRPEDEYHLQFLGRAWNLDRSEIARKALAIAASQVKQETALTKKEIIETSNFIGLLDERDTEPLRLNYKRKIKESLRKKYERSSKK